MDKNEAKLLLQACRSNGQDKDLPFFAEALALAERDPELKTWWEAQQAFDRKISTKLKEIPVPANLRANILAGRKVVKITPHRPLVSWLAIAATLMVLGVAGTAFFRSKVEDSRILTSTHYDQAAIAFLGNDAPSLGTTSPDHAQLLAWLQQRNSPTGTIPANMGQLPSVGCQTFSVHGHSVSLICFSLASGTLAHLFIVERGALADPPGASPSFGQNGNWATASWSDSDKSYLLVSSASVNTLKQLL